MPSRIAVAVAKFHAGLPGDTPRLRRDLTREEHLEAEVELAKLEGHSDSTGDRRRLAKELADVVYVAYGTALVYGIDLDAALAAVHEANMTKLRDGVFRRDGKVMRGPNYVEPDMSDAVMPRGALLP